MQVNNPPASAGDMRCRFDPQVRKIPWRRAWQPTPVFLPGESHGQRSLAGYSPWGRKQSDMTELTEHTHGIFLRNLWTVFHGGQAALEALGLPRGGRGWTRHSCVDYQARAAPARQGSWWPRYRDAIS